ncbi:Os12g0162450, partial [Oryza sativa Japonica Group]
MLSFLLVLNSATEILLTLLIKPSSTTALLIFLNSSYSASISFTNLTNCFPRQPFRILQAVGTIGAVKAAALEQQRGEPSEPFRGIHH